MLRPVICDNFESYADSVKRELEDTDACIWTIAVTPSKLKTVPFEDAYRISRDYAVTAIRALADLRHNQDWPLRFIHIHQRSFCPAQPGRGEAESRILAYAEQSKGSVQSCVTKSGLIEAPGRERRIIPGLPIINLREFAAALLDQVVNGLEKDTLLNDDMVRIG
ncbi:hypothetical protein F4815DRAFT_440310 [Daldinia loculata]|nr:hypothetical protein F4815DRAFT_440310 [Daldinia loculata]